MKAEYDLSKMKSRKNSYASKLKNRSPCATLFARRAQKPSATFLEENVAWEKYTSS